MFAWVDAGIIGLLLAAGISVSAWHGVAYAELATLAGAERAGTALGLGNTSVFGVMFLTTQAVPVLLGLGAWPAVWCAVGLCAIVTVPLFPARR